MKIHRILATLLPLALIFNAERSYGTDFNLRLRPPGPGHSQPTYWWRFNDTSWELVTPEGFALSGGGEMWLRKKDDSSETAFLRPCPPSALDLLASKDSEKQAKYVLGLLPPGATDVKLVSQGTNTLAVHGLSNFEVVYDYTLGGLPTRLIYIVSQSFGEDPKNPNKGESFTTLITAPPAKSDEIYHGFMQLLGTARVSQDEPHSDAFDQYKSHGMLGR